MEDIELTEKESIVFDYIRNNPRRTASEMAKDLGFKNYQCLLEPIFLLRNKKLIKDLDIHCYEAEV